MDPVSMSAALAGGKAAVGVIKSSIKVIQAMGKIDIVNDLIGTQAAILELMEKQGELAEENRALQKQIEDLTQQLEDRGTFTAHKGVLFQKGDNGKYKPIVYCPNCYAPAGTLDLRIYTCPECGWVTRWDWRPDTVASELDNAPHPGQPRIE